MGILEDRLTNGILERCNKTGEMLGKQISLPYPQKLTRSDVERMVKPLQWEESEKRTSYEDGFTEVYHSSESIFLYGTLKFSIFKCHNRFKELRLLDCFKGQSISIKSGNYSLDEIKQYAQKWLVDWVCSTLGVEG